ncbi:DNA damage-regulated autophagy modulator protein 2-like isoform X2 [Panulirus ornatus]|uniref:DNA damage-regulated autophagy modulator protein 2-like isoform X2 n=1 Tax=Panulirus ornatus TaxID=150431 RepID=UPI003A838303
MGDVRSLAWLPLSAALMLPLTFLITYVWAVLEGHVEPDFPYISKTGTYPPESCFFSQMLNILALLMGLAVWVRHRMIEDYCAKNVTSNSIPSRSKVSAFFGYTAAAGISLVGNFQATNVGSIHILGAFLAFGVGNVYLWIQSLLSYSLEPRLNSKEVSHVRLAASLVATLMLVTTVVFSVLQAQANDDEFEFKRVSMQSVVFELDRDRRQVRETPDPAASSDTIVEDIRL